MLGKILGSGQLGKLASLVSPSFFAVMPAKKLWKRARELYAQSHDPEAFRHAVAERSSELRARLPQIVLDLTEIEHDARRTRGPRDAEARGAAVVELYFHQLFSPKPTLLDLRAQSFRDEKNDQLHWHPASWIANWSPDFIEPMRAVYRGFYGRNTALFRSGLEALSLSHAEDLFREQFGGEQREMRFHTKDFVASFHAVFERCKAMGSALHPDFLPLGIYLAALYDHLDELGVAVDVGAAFERATSAQRARESTHA